MSNPNIIKSSKTVRKTLPSGEVQETSIVTTRQPSGLPQRSSGIPQSRIRQPSSFLPAPSGSGTQTVSSQSIVTAPDGRRTIKKKTQVSNIPAVQISAPTPPAPRSFLQPPKSYGVPTTSTGAIPRRPTQPQGPVKITQTKTRSTVDPSSGKKHTTKKSTVRTLKPPTQTAPVRPADVSTVNIQQDALNLTQLERQVARDLVNSSRASGYGKATGSRVERTSTPVMTTPDGTVPVEKQIIVESKLDRSAEGEQIHRHIITTERQPDNTSQRIELAGQELQPADDLEEPAHDIVSIQSTISVGGGVKQTTTKVVYETDRPDGASMSPEEAAKLVDEENQDIDEVLNIIPPDLKSSPTSYPLRKRVQNMVLSPGTVEILEQSIVMPTPTGDEETPELQPELIATIMYTEETGVAMESQPNEVYDYLFPEDKIEKYANASSAAPAVVQDVIVPMMLPTKMEASTLSDELQAAAAAVHNIPTQPTENAFSKTVKTDEPKVKNIAKPKKRRKAKPLSEEQPPWDVEDMQTIADLVGAVPASPLVEEQQLDMSVDKDPTLHGIDFMLELQPPRHVSRVQLRGSQKPSWFPGYVVALPTIPDLVRVDRTPNNVLSSAWRAVQPDAFAEDSFLFI